MSVRLDAATPDGLTLEQHGTLYAFCRAGCLEAFRADPHLYTQSRHVASPSAEPSLPVIDDGMRRWYESCSCCLSDAFPEIKAALDDERRAQAKALAADGICEVAEAAEAH